MVMCTSTKGQSIYSFEGLGSLEHQGMPNNFMMGEVGIGSPSPWHVNTLNPANLSYNNFSTFQLGLELDSRRFTGSEVSGNDTNGSLRFLGYAFPIIPSKWSSSFGILPYSSVNYNTFSEKPVDGIENVRQISDDRGEGGLTSFYWANGFRIKKKLSIGFRANYVFGSIDKESIIFLQEIGQEVNDGDTVEVRAPIGSTINYTIRESYNDVNFLIGLGYRYDIGETTFLNFGLIYAPKSKLNGQRDLALTRLGITGGELDSQELSSTDIGTNLPQIIGIGASYQKLNHYTIGFDIEIQNWESSQGNDENFTDFTKVAVGVDWIPDFDNVSSYFKRAKYSFGFNRTKLPYVVNGQSLIDFGINFGASLPVSGFSSVDVAIKVGQLGETSNDLIRENYFKIVLGATINDRWFVKRRYD